MVVAVEAVGEVTAVVEGVAPAAAGIESAESPLADPLGEQSAHMASSSLSTRRKRTQGRRDTAVRPGP
jgi:hypothetical protein